MSENMLEVYVGALPILLLLALGFMRGRLWSREIRFFSIAAAALLIYAVGRYTHVFTWFYDYIPGTDLFRRPADATYALGAMVSIASGYSLHLIVSGNETPDRKTKYVVPGVIAALIAISLGVAAAHGQLDWAVWPVLLSSAVFAAGWLVLHLAHRYAGRYRVATIALLAGFVTLDLVIGNGPNRSTAQPPSKYEELRVDTRNETIAFLKDRLDHPSSPAQRYRVEMVGVGFEWPNIGLIHNFDHVMGYNPLRLGIAVDGLGASETVAEVWERRFTPLYPSYRSLMADMLGLRYIAVKQPIETVNKTLKPGDLKLVTRTKDAYIYENIGALPRVMFASEWLPADFGQLIKDGRWPKFDPMRTVLLDKSSLQAPAFRSLPVSLSKATVALRTYKNTEVEIDEEFLTGGFVVLNDVWHPWWFGTVDGKPAEVLRANVVFRAIGVPPGKHTVRFELRPVEGALKEIATRFFGQPRRPGADANRRPQNKPQANGGSQRSTSS